MMGASLLEFFKGPADGHRRVAGREVTEFTVSVKDAEPDELGRKLCHVYERVGIMKNGVYVGQGMNYVGQEWR